MPYAIRGVMAPQYAGSALLPPQLPKDAGKICLVLDLDETLVHSSFRVCRASMSRALTIRSRYRMRTSLCRLRSRARHIRRVLRRDWHC